jgi:hypothetical protein
MKLLFIIAITGSQLLGLSLPLRPSSAEPAGISSFSQQQIALDAREENPDNESIQDIAPGVDPVFDEAEPPLEEDKPEILPAEPVRASPPVRDHKQVRQSSTPHP